MGRVVRRFFILPNAARSHDLIDIRLMSVQPGAIVPSAIRRRRAGAPINNAKPASPAPAAPSAPVASPQAGNEHNETPGRTTTAEPLAPAAPAPTTKPRPTPAQKPGTDRPKAWHVVLLDSDQHTYEYVIEMMMKLFRHPTEKAFEIARQVDKAGRAVCVTTHRELAELRVEQVRGFGNDPRIASSKVAMRCYLEPAE